MHQKRLKRNLLVPEAVHSVQDFFQLCIQLFFFDIDRSYLLPQFVHVLVVEELDVQVSQGVVLFPQKVPPREQNLVVLFQALDLWLINIHRGLAVTALAIYLP